MPIAISAPPSSSQRRCSCVAWARSPPSSKKRCIRSMTGKVASRPEATAGVVRAVAEHWLLYDGGKRLYYMGPMFRHERPQRARYRQYHQVGAEALGFPGPELDAE